MNQTETLDSNGDFILVSGITIRDLILNGYIVGSLKIDATQGSAEVTLSIYAPGMIRGYVERK